MDRAGTARAVTRAALPLAFALLALILAGGAVLDNAWGAVPDVVSGHEYADNIGHDLGADELKGDPL